MPSPYEIATAEAVKDGKTGQIALGVIAYRTRGGSYLVATEGKYTDSGDHRDLLLVLPMYLETESRVVVLYPAVNPDFVSAVRAAVDGVTPR